MRKKAYALSAILSAVVAVAIAASVAGAGTIIQNSPARSSGGGAISPPAQSTLSLWFSAQDVDGFSNALLTDGSHPNSWHNKGTTGTTGDATVSGTATFNLVAQAGYLNNKSSVSFNGTNTKFTSGAISNLTQSNMMMVIYKLASSKTQILVDGNNDTNRESIYLDASNNLTLYAGGAGNTAPWGPAVNSTYNFAIVTFNGTSTRVRINNWPVAIPSGTPGTGSIDGIQFGSGRSGGFLNGEIVEILVWHGTLPTEADAASYATAVYGSSSFPAAVDYVGGTGKITIAGGSKVAFLGDSLSASGGTGLWHLQSGGYVDQINAGVSTPITVVSSGVGGNTAALLDARVNTDIVALSPQPSSVIITDVYNDYNTAVAALSFITSVRSVISKLKAIPSVKIGWINMLSAGNEQFPDANYLKLLSYNNCLVQACMEVTGCTIMDVTTAKESYEATNNSSNSTSGLLTQDTVHPTIPTGKLLMATVAMARTTLSP
jgi:hypothetical protein